MGRFINKFGLQSLQKNVTSSGTPVKLSGHIIASTISFTAATNTVADSASGFLNAGFRVGDQITVTGTVSNNAIYQISTVTAASIVISTTPSFAATTYLKDESAGSAFTITETGSGYPVDDGIKILIKAKRGNSGYITIGSSSAAALKTSTSHFKLYLDQSIELQVDNLSKIWMDSSVSAEGVEILYEA